ncbi:CCDC113/CCDC96 coiled-coil domain-containing protein [Plasmodiophora brassicae]
MSTPDDVEAVVEDDAASVQEDADARTPTPPDNEEGAGDELVAGDAGSVLDADANDADAAASSHEEAVSSGEIESPREHDDDADDVPVVEDEPVDDNVEPEDAVVPEDDSPPETVQEPEDVLAAITPTPEPGDVPGELVAASDPTSSAAAGENPSDVPEQKAAPAEQAPASAPEPVSVPTPVVSSQAPSAMPTVAVAAVEPPRPVPENVASLRRMLREANEEHRQLSSTNLSLQARVLALRAESPTAPAPADKASPSSPGGLSARLPDSKQQYGKKVDQVAELYNVFRAKQDAFNAKIDRLNAKLDEEDENAAELRESFKEFKREICKAAISNRTGGGISMKKIEKFEAMETDKDKELESLRLKNIHYRNQLRKLEAAVKQKEQLSEGLHLIDFEQLKIENQTLNEKIEERNDDLHKLKKKITTTVQVLTHIKEKLQFVELENVSLQESLTNLDTDLQAVRDQVTKAKRVRDRLRQETNRLKERQGFVGSNLLVQDFERRKVDLVHLEQQIDELRRHHEHLSNLLRPETSRR